MHAVQSIDCLHFSRLINKRKQLVETESYCKKQSVKIDSSLHIFTGTNFCYENLDKIMGSIESSGKLSFGAVTLLLQHLLQLLLPPLYPWRPLLLYLHLHRHCRRRFWRWRACPRRRHPLQSLASERVACPRPAWPAPSFSPPLPLASPSPTATKSSYPLPPPIGRRWKRSRRALQMKAGARKRAGLEQVEAAVDRRVRLRMVDGASTVYNKHVCFHRFSSDQS